MPRRQRYGRKKPNDVEAFSPKGSTLYTEAPPTPQALPLDPIYTEQTGANALLHFSERAGINYDRGQVGQEYGFDAAGNLDPTNPYSVAANLQRRYQQGQAGITNSFASQGQLYSGARQRNADEGTYQYGRAYDQARRGAAGAYQDLNEREAAANFGLAQNNANAGADRLLRLDPSQTVPEATTIPRTQAQSQQIQRRYRRRRPR